MSSRIAVLFAVAISTLFTAVPFSRAAELDEARFQELHGELRASQDEPWRTIPWRIALLGAQRTAAEEKKPLFIWAMDGHPLGCT